MYFAAAAEAADSGGRKRRPLDAGLTGEQLRHARKRRMKETAPAVKEMLKPLYASKKLDKVQLQMSRLVQFRVAKSIVLPIATASCSLLHNLCKLWCFAFAGGLQGGGGGGDGRAG
jgi:hypothetical protein